MLLSQCKTFEDLKKFKEDGGNEYYFIYGDKIRKTAKEEVNFTVNKDCDGFAWLWSGRNDGLIRAEISTTEAEMEPLLRDAKRKSLEQKIKELQEQKLAELKKLEMLEQTIAKNRAELEQKISDARTQFEQEVDYERKYANEKIADNRTALENKIIENQNELRNLDESDKQTAEQPKPEQPTDGVQGA